MKRILSWAVLFMAILSQAAAGYAADKKVRVACVGNSITYGSGVENREQNAYPMQLARMLGDDFEVKGFGRPGATLLRKGHNPYNKTQEYADALAFRPDIVVIHLGVNDTDPRDWPEHNDEFVSDYLKLIDSFKEQNPDVRVIIANITPILTKHRRYRSGTRTWRDKVRQTIERIAEISGAELIDYGTALRDFPDLQPDGIHPDSAGSKILAETALQAITGNYGGLRMPAVYGPGMVLQRYKPLTINGSANAGATVKLTLGKPGDKSPRTASTVANNRGQWSLTLPPMAEAEGLEMSVTDGELTLNFPNVAIGEVWLASGQSNMEFQLKFTTTFKADSAMFNDPGLHLYDMKPRVVTNSHPWSEAELDSVDHLNYYLPAHWAESTWDNARNFSAIAWYFGKMLRDSLNVPVGIICNAIGGSGTCAWVDIETLEHGMPELLNDWRHNDYLQPWVQQRARENAGENHRHPYQPNYLFATGIRPLGTYPIAGVIWYQGESNAHNTEIHYDLFKLLVESFRNNWSQPELPFIFTQLSSIDRPSWPEFRDSQRRLALDVPGTAMAVSSDLGDSLDVHPRNKRPVAQRLARQALNRVYSMTNITPSGPLPLKAVVTAPGTVELTMQFANGLKTSDGKAPRTFEIARYDGQFVPAEATITPDNRVILTNMDIENPRYVRYGWQPFTRANLVNDDNLPASTFKIPVTEDICCEPWINAGVSAAFAGVADGHLLRAGGCNFPGNPMATDAKKKFYAGIYNMTLHNGVIESKLIGTLPEPMAYGAAATTPQGMVIVGGTTATEALATAWLINVNAEGKAVCTPLPSLPATVDNCAAAYIDGKVYVAGGNVNGQPANELYALDMNRTADGWKALKSFPGNPRVQPVLAASDADGKARLYMWGGFAGKGEGREASLNTDGLCYTIANGKWTSLAAPKGSDAKEVSTGGGTAVTLSDGRIYVSGGVNKDVFLEALRNQAPDYLSHPVEWYGFNTLGFIYSPKDAAWTIYGQGPETARAGAAATLAPDGAVVIFGGEIKPRIRTADSIRIPVE